MQCPNGLAFDSFQKLCNWDFLINCDDNNAENDENIPNDNGKLMAQW